MNLRERFAQAVVRHAVLPLLDDALSTWGLRISRLAKPPIRIRTRDPLSRRLRRLRQAAARWKVRA